MKSLVKILGLLSMIAMLFVGCHNQNDLDDPDAYSSVEDIKALFTSDKAVISWTNPEENWFGVRIDIVPEVADWDSTKIYKNETSILVENLSAGTEYTFIFTTIDKNGKDTDKIASLKVETQAISEPVVDETAPANVTNLVATNVDGCILLTWTDAADEDIFGYEIIYSEAEAARAVVPMEKESVFVAQGKERYLVAELEPVVEYNFTVITMDVSGNKSSGVSVKATSKFVVTEKYVPFADLKETSAHPMKYIIDFADLIDFVKGKDDNVSADGIFTIANNEEYGVPDESDRQSIIGVEEMFKNNFPKMGDVIELHGKFTSDIDIDNMIFMLVDRSPVADNWWEMIIKDPKVIVSKDKTNDFTLECPVINDCTENNISFVVAYGKYNANGACAKLKFEHCIATNVKPMDAPVADKKIEAISDSGTSGIQLKINMDVPETAVSGEVIVCEEKNFYYSYGWKTYHSYGIKFDAKDKTVGIPYVTAEKNYFLKVRYFDKDSKVITNKEFGEVFLRVKAESGKGFEKGLPPIYEIDFSPYLNFLTFPGDGWYGCGTEMDAITVFGKTLPKKGDRIKWSFTGTFSIDMEKIDTWISSDDKNCWGYWGNPVEIKAGQEVTISGVAYFDYDLQEKFSFIISYDSKYGDCVFAPKGWKGTIYEVDLTPYMNAVIFNDDNWATPFENVDTVDLFDGLPKKGDFIKCTFTGKFSVDLDHINMCIDSCGNNDEWFQICNGWNTSITAKAGKYVTVSRLLSCESDSATKIKFKFEHEGLKGESFTPKGWKDTSN